MRKVRSFGREENRIRLEVGPQAIAPARIGCRCRAPLILGPLNLLSGFTLFVLFDPLDWSHYLIRIKFSLGNYSATVKTKEKQLLQHILHCFTSNLTTALPDLNEELRIQSNGCETPTTQLRWTAFFQCGTHVRRSYCNHRS